MLILIFKLINVTALAAHGKEKSQTMKISKRIIFLAVLICLGILCESGCSSRKMTKSEAVEMFKKAGGIDKINEEAKIVFDVFGTNAVYILQDYHISHLQDYPEIRRRPEIKDFPAIFALGDVVLLQRDSSGSPPEINIRFGIHRRAKAIRIFPPNLDIDKAPNFRAVSAFTNESWYIRIAPNIFVER
jgi:hypothetical protein